MFSLFFSLSIVFALYEFTTLLFPLRYNNYLNKIRSGLKYNGLEKNDRPFALFHFLYFIWSVIGLFTYQWYNFLLIVLLSTLSQFISKKIRSLKNDRYYSIHRIFDAILSIFVLIKIFIDNI